MQVVTRHIGGVLSPGNNARLVIYRRRGRRVCPGIKVPSGTSSFILCLQVVRRPLLGRYVVQLQVWCPCERAPMTANCRNWLQVGIAFLPDASSVLLPRRSRNPRPSWACFFGVYE